MIRGHRRAVYDPELIAEILDEAVVCHLAFLHEGRPVIVPTAHARVDRQLYLHGSAAGRAARSLIDGAEVCVTVTLLDGLVLARSAFEHSINYRSVIVYGTPRQILAAESKLRALEAFTERLVPGRWEQVRQPTAAELKATSVLALPLDEASAKVREGPPDDGAGKDAEWPVWAGEIPLRRLWGPAVEDPTSRVRVAAPEYVRQYRRPQP